MSIAKSKNNITKKLRRSDIFIALDIMLFGASAKRYS